MGKPSFTPRSLSVFGFIFFLWAVEFLDQLWLGGRLDRYGIQPRQIIGLFGVAFAPFLHGGFGHLASNTLPLLGLGWFVLQTRHWLQASLWAVLAAGLGTWLLAESGSTHIGASGLVAGYLGYLLQRSLLTRAWMQTGGWLILVLILWTEELNALSWHSHVFGFMGGLLAAQLEERSGQHNTET